MKVCVKLFPIFF